MHRGPAHHVFGGVQPANGSSLRLGGAHGSPTLDLEQPRAGRRGGMDTVRRGRSPFGSRSFHGAWVNHGSIPSAAGSLLGGHEHPRVHDPSACFQALKRSPSDTVDSREVVDYIDL